jgi:hypothetical protein
MNCGGDTEQKVNGVISYIPTAMVGGAVPEIKLEDANGPKKA